MTQINTPYPATAYLTGFLREAGVDAVQADPAIEVLLKLLCRKGLSEIVAVVTNAFPPGTQNVPRSVRHFLRTSPQYLATIDAVIGFLQGRNPTLAHRICTGEWLPQGPRFDTIPDFESPTGDKLEWAFGAMGISDRAQYLASLYVDDLADVIREGVDPRFELSRYAEKLAASAPSFDPLLEGLQAEPSLVDRYLDEVTNLLIQKHQPALVGITVPFPGNVYGAFRIAQEVKRVSPKTQIVLGGGYINTELRELRDPRVFDFVDYLTFDDGEKPLLCLIESLRYPEGTPRRLRTLLREEGQVVFKTDADLHDIPFARSGTPTYDGLPLGSYLSLCELLNPMHRLWSDGRWNKLTIAHGCYWKKCSFCDVTLDYIGRYDVQPAVQLVEKIEKLIAETGSSGFHFVDEAAPPKALAAMAQGLIDRGTAITWWGNIRFEEAFDDEKVALLAASGCVAVSGGLEVASDRLLALMKKGVTVEQVARVTRAFTQKGIMVHAYLMYGFPTQTLQESIDALERVRQLFAAGCLQSAYWHRFSATIHSPVGKDPASYGIRLLPVPSTFATNDVAFEDPTGCDHDALAPGLKKALYNFMHGIGLDDDVRQWFEIPVPKTKVSKGWIESALTGTPSKVKHGR